MKIIDRNQLGSLASAVAGAGQAGAVDPKQGANQGGAGKLSSDRADVSGLAERLAEVSSGQSPQRTARVEQLKAAVAAGRYVADAGAVSKAIVNDALTGNPPSGETPAGNE
jgi:flagellar biosynthesis anti-sigma factor FlgM